MYVAVMAFNAKISDPSIGGTYMTLLNTISNLAGNWPATLALWLVDPLTVKKCIGAPEQSCRSAIDSEVSFHLLEVWMWDCRDGVLFVLDHNKSDLCWI